MIIPGHIYTIYKITQCQHFRQFSLSTLLVPSLICSNESSLEMTKNAFYFMFLFLFQRCFRS